MSLMLLANRHVSPSLVFYVTLSTDPPSINTNNDCAARRMTQSFLLFATLILYPALPSYVISVSGIGTAVIYNVYGVLIVYINSLEVRVWQR